MHGREFILKNKNYIENKPSHLYKLKNSDPDGNGTCKLEKINSLTKSFEVPHNIFHVGVRKGYHPPDDKKSLCVSGELTDADKAIDITSFGSKRYRTGVSKMAEGMGAGKYKTACKGGGSKGQHNLNNFNTKYRGIAQKKEYYQAELIHYTI